MGHRGATAFRAAAVAFTCLGCVLLPASALAETSDAQVVFCLSPEHESDLRAAATALGIPVPDANSQLATWRKGSPADFNRACAALYAADVPPPVDVQSGDSWFTRLLPFLTGLAGAIFAYVATALQARRNRGATLGDSLRTAIMEFHQAATSYLHSRSAAERSEVDVIIRRNKLVEQFVMVKGERRGWEVANALYQKLTEGDLGKPHLTVDWSQNTEETRQHQQDMINEVDMLRNTGLDVAVALAQPLRPHPALASTKVTGAA